MPPPLNNLFATFRGRRIPSRRYKAWIALAGLKLSIQRPRIVRGPFRVTMVYVRPDRRKRDLDGLAKAPMDLLVKAGVVEDDSLCESILLRWSDGAPDKMGGVRIVVEAV